MGMGVYFGPSRGSQLSVVQTSLSPSSTFGWSTPLTLSQTSLVQALPSSRGILSWLRPSAGSHASVVHASPSSTGRGRCFTWPVVGSHESRVHSLPSSTTLASDAWQSPSASQVGWPVHASPEPHAAPAALGLLLHLVLSQVSSVQGSPSSHSAFDLQPVHAGSTTCAGPATGSQVSFVHGLPSPTGMGVWVGKPVAELHASFVHLLLSSMLGTADVSR